jgi:ABC-2 type transport system permease protein
VLAVLALNALPATLASYREKGILRRLSTTPVAPSQLLRAQLVINAAVAAITLILLVVVGRFAFAVGLPRQVSGFLVAIVLAGAALFAIGLAIAAAAPTARVALVVGQILFYPLMFFAGLWVPRATMPDALRRISDFTPLGAAAQALQDSMQGRWPLLLHLTVLAAYAALFGLLAVKWFRWEE